MQYCLVCRNEVNSWTLLLLPLKLHTNTAEWLDKQEFTSVHEDTRAHEAPLPQDGSKCFLHGVAKEKAQIRDKWTHTGWRILQWLATPPPFPSGGGGANVVVEEQQIRSTAGWTSDGTPGLCSAGSSACPSEAGWSFWADREVSWHADLRLMGFLRKRILRNRSTIYKNIWLFLLSSGSLLLVFFYSFSGVKEKNSSGVFLKL